MSEITENKEYTFMQRLANLLTVKSLITLILTGVFAYLAVVDKVNAEQFQTVFTVIVSFYFGVQTTKGKE